MKNKNIGILVDSLEHGGMERVAANLSTALENSGYKIFVFVSQYHRKKYIHIVEELLKIIVELI